MLEQIQSSTCLSNLDAHSGNLFLLLLNTLLASQCTLKNPDLYPPDNSAKLEDGDHFDFIVVGTGSSGSVVGSRLTEEKKWKVLVVEAGDYPSVTSEIPAIFFSVQQMDQVWKYSTKPAEKSCLGYKNSICHCTRGKLLGGCSSINGMMYQRGSKKDHDLWYQEGNEGWDYTSLTEFYEKSENVDADVQHVHEYGQKGLLNLTMHKLNETIRDVILQSAEELGYNLFEREGPSGFFESFQAIKDGVRMNSAKAFLGAIKGSSELTLALNAHVEKVILDKTSKEARGIKLRIGKKVMNIYSDKEVILSAGVINSPQILMLSGIGPKNHLQKVGIDVVEDLAVGTHLKDHVIMWVFSKVADEALKSRNMLDEIYEYFAHRKGTLSHGAVLSIQGYTNVNDNSTNPDILFLYSIIPKNSTTTLDIFTDSINLNSLSSEKLREYIVNNHILVTLVLLLQPKSEGKILLKNKDATSYPEIQPGYFTDENNEDLDTIVKGIRIAERQLKTEAFKELNAEILDIGLPNCKHLDFDSDEYWRCAVRNLGTTAYHMTSTCKMGPKSDHSAVVDARLKVHGIKNLRVIDGSIMPNIVSGPPHAACTMIGQKGAQMIIDDHTNTHNEL